MRFGDALTMSTAAVDPKTLARAKLAERRRRVHKLRRTVIATAVVLFVTLWAVIFMRLVTGHDPVLAAKAQAVATTGSTSSGAASTASTSGSAARGPGLNRPGPSTVTTRQS